MQAVGIVVEYNPFHNGHAYHLEQAKKVAQADIVVAVMSGDFLQRGEPAMVDKWTRTKMALAGGVDIVIELPYVYSTAPATDFAKGAISLLSAIGCGSFAFGSEDGSIQPFTNTFQLINNHRTEYNTLIKESLKTGASYPKSLHYAYEQLSQKFPATYIDLGQPNNILGFHYIEAATTLGSNIKPLTIPRIVAGYHDALQEGASIASATGIRKALATTNTLQSVEDFLPKASFDYLADWYEKYGEFASWETFWPLLQFTLIRHTPHELTRYAEVTEGIENALIKAAKTSHSFSSFMEKIKSKRYTWTRLQRMLTHIYTGLTKEQLQSFDAPSSIRLLGMSKKGQRYLGMHKKDIPLPLISRVAAMDDAMLAVDIHAAEVYNLSIEQGTKGQSLPKDYQTPPIRF
ncbi:nucleotidyltransferase [Lysinibacillus sphaericus]|uniref:tRNA(Met) cytidine acetate ligase n=1 Tax=Lysinibacillus sphaericus TaxID=1421 RepID=A0A544UX43_LYSSH|nr:nucleotidyltransferase [Lysinibacillus sp. SDF0037]TQR38414.1 nucleotidyltransferase [Lysinibacillus sp. SDF0037]